MSIPPTTSVTPGPAGPAADKDKQLQKVAHQMEGSFVQQLYKTMRDTVPDDGPFNGGTGEQMFTGLLDQHTATETPNQWHHGLSESIYHQLREHMQTQATRTTQPTPDVRSS